MSEDGDKNTFAGIHDTFLNIPLDLHIISENVKKCWASLFSERSLIYRTQRKLPTFEGMAVIIQNMIQAKSSGVVYTRHPIDKSYILIECSYGIGDSVVDGTVHPDQILIERNTHTVISKEIGTKRTVTRLFDGSHKRQMNEIGSEILSINEETIDALVSVSLLIEDILGSPQDIEWAYDNQLWILQSRTVNF